MMVVSDPKHRVRIECWEEQTHGHILGGWNGGHWSSCFEANTLCVKGSSLWCGVNEDPADTAQSGVATGKQKEQRAGAGVGFQAQRLLIRLAHWM